MDDLVMKLIMFGKTGSGKSSLGNVLTSSRTKNGAWDPADSFHVQESTTSITKDAKRRECNAMRLEVTNTRGLLDSALLKANSGVLGQSVIGLFGEQAKRWWRRLGQAGKVLVADVRHVAIQRCGSVAACAAVAY